MIFAFKISYEMGFTKKSSAPASRIWAMKCGLLDTESTRTGVVVKERMVEHISIPASGDKVISARIISGFNLEIVFLACWNKQEKVEKGEGDGNKVFINSIDERLSPTINKFIEVSNCF